MGTVEFSCDLSQQGIELLHCWEHTVGSCHAPIALRADWQQQLRRCHSELGFRYVRFHGLLSDDVGTVVKHNDELLYSFFNADQIIDFLLSIGMKPFVEQLHADRARVPLPAKIGETLHTPVITVEGGEVSGQ